MVNNLRALKFEVCDVVITKICLHTVIRRWPLTLEQYSGNTSTGPINK